MPDYLMGVTRIRESGVEAEVVLGPCPGCQSWQLDYTQAASAQFDGAFDEAVEALLQEHLEECPHLRRLLSF